MNGPVADAARLVLFPIGATALGAAGATLGRVNDRISGFVQHFAAGWCLLLLLEKYCPACATNTHSKPS